MCVCVCAYIYMFMNLCRCIYLCVCIYIYFGMMVRVVANGPGDLSSTPGRVIPKTQKMVHDASFLNT